MQVGETPDSPRAKRLQNLNLRPGRKWGSKSKIPQDLKQAIVDAASAYGSDGHGTGELTGYLFWLASRHPKAFSGLLGKLLPYQLTGTLRSVVGQINIVSVPSTLTSMRPRSRSYAPRLRRSNTRLSPSPRLSPRSPSS
jgi:hypothetical protein